MKHGTHANVCNLNIRLLKAMLNMGKIHEVPCLAVNWPSDDYGELIRDGTENLTISKLVDAIARGDGQHVDFISAQQRYMSNEYGSRLVRRAGYSLPPPSVYEIGTTDLLSRIGVNSSDPTYRKIMARESSIVYDIGMRPESCRRQDPYTGAQFVYDYLYCRNGPNPADKHTNLILHLPQLTRELWYRCNPNDSNSKSCNWYLTADALWFENGIDLLR
jgi:hypothetical protein